MFQTACQITGLIAAPPLWAALLITSIKGETHLCQHFQVNSPTPRNVRRKEEQHTRKIVRANRQLRQKFYDHRQHRHPSFGPKGRFSRQRVFRPRNCGRPRRLPRPKLYCRRNSRTAARHHFQLLRIKSHLNKVINDHANDNDINRFRVHNRSGLTREHKLNQHWRNIATRDPPAAPA